MAIIGDKRLCRCTVVKLNISVVHRPKQHPTDASDNETAFIRPQKENSQPGEVLSLNQK
ncbi:hypothetical protein ACTXT7_001018 [Hymenolepis weldensis]